jgi:hypothetical protein
VRLTRPGIDASTSEIGIVEMVRTGWEAYFERETLAQGAAVTPLAGVVYVDGAAGGSLENGTWQKPFDAVSEAAAATPGGGTLLVRAGVCSGVQRIETPMTIRSVLGATQIQR